MTASKATPKKRQQFCDVLAAGGSVTKAAATIHINRMTAYRWRERDKGFAKDWDDAIERGTDLLEDVAIERAMDKSDTMLIFMLKARRPEKFKERYEAAFTGNIAVTVVTGVPDRG